MLLARRCEGGVLVDNVLQINDIVSSGKGNTFSVETRRQI